MGESVEWEEDTGLGHMEPQHFEVGKEETLAKENEKDWPAWLEDSRECGITEPRGRGFG